MLIGLPGSGAAAHTDIFDGTAKAGHFVPLEVCQTDEHIGIHHGASDLRFLHIFAALHRDGNIIGTLESVPDEDGTADGIGGKAVEPCAFEMLQRVFPAQPAASRELRHPGRA